MGEFFKKLERDCVDIQKQWWREETIGEFFEEIWRGFAWMSKNQYWREESMGGFLKVFPPSSMVWGSLLEKGNAPGWMGGADRSWGPRPDGWHADRSWGSVATACGARWVARARYWMGSWIGA